MKRDRYEDEFPMGFVLIWLGMFAAAWIFVATVNGNDETKILKCAETPNCLNPFAG